MNSLVADYGSDADSSDLSGDETKQTAVQTKDGQTAVGRESLGKTHEGKNFLIADNTSSDSDSGESTLVKGNNSRSPLPNPMAEKFPSPHLRSAEMDSAGLVFVNKFEKAEQAKQSVLEKHVKMTANEHVKGKNVKVCFKFRKGRCPFGKNCKFSHDMDTNLSLKYRESAETIDPSETSNTGHIPPAPPRIGFMGNMATMHSNKRSYQGYPPQQEEDDDNYMANAKRKKRAGISESLLPPKKAMSALQREDERPWTVKK